MPSAKDHLALTHHNLHVLSHLSTDKQYSDWVVIVAAYTGLHVLEALIFLKDDKRIRIKHCPDHGTRENIFKSIYPTVWKKYRPLFSASKVARYLKIEGEQGQTFRGYYSDDVVCDMLFKKYLGGVISQVKTILNGSDILSDIEVEFGKCKSSLETQYR